MGLLMSKPPRNKIRVGVFLGVSILLGILAGCLFFEVGLRCYFYFTFKNAIARHKLETADSPGARNWLGDLIQRERNSNLVFRMKPNVSANYLGTPVETNSLGLRDSELSPTKEDNVIRVLGIGDSTMFGFGVDRENSYLEALERQLTWAFEGVSNVEVINAAVPSYNAMQEVELFHLLHDRIQPDAVLIQFDANDLYWVPPFIEIKHFLRIDRLYITHIGAIYRGTFWTDEFWQVEQIRAAQRAQGRTGWAAVHNAYRRLSETCSSSGIPLLAIVPYWKQGVHPDTITSQAFERFIGLCDELGIATSETLPEVLRYTAGSSMTINDLIFNFPTDMHPTTLGHSLIARSVFPSLFKAIAMGRLTDQAVAQKLNAYREERFSIIQAYGFYVKEDWGGVEVRWTEGSAQMLIRNGAAHFFFRYWVGHPDISIQNPVQVRLRIGSSPPISETHTERGFYTQRVDNPGDRSAAPTLQIEVDRTFSENEGQGRELGIGVYPIEYE